MGLGPADGGLMFLLVCIFLSLALKIPASCALRQLCVGDKCVVSGDNRGEIK